MAEDHPRVVPAFHRLYDEAWRRFAAHALWSMRPLARPGREDAREVARALRVEGNMAARRFAERIEEACRAAD